ncbi:MAG: TRAP transporter large permease subunit [Desulfobacteraceae bacterium]|nr:TRAP transporter large permease subunit [Desulfobacteraceae bacterium]
MYFSPEFMAVAMFVTLILFITMGHPLAITLAAVATIFGLIDNGFNFGMLFNLFCSNSWGTFNSYTLVALPLFIFMAQLLDKSKVAEKLFEVLYLDLGSIRGGLGIAVVVVCTVFAATTGIIGASVVAMGLLATPPLINKGYQKEMASGIICSAGTLGILIPPSIMMVIYGGLTGMQATSVGNLFAASIIPGLLLAGLYIVYIWIRCTINPDLGPTITKEEASKYSAGQKLWLTMVYLVPPLTLILLVMGTILMGIATPTEAAGMGAAGAFILALANRTLSWDVLQQVATNTLKTTCMVMFLFLAGKMFSQVFMSMGGSDVVADLLVGGMNPAFAVFLMLFIVFILGMFIDWAAILLITVPIFLPIAGELGYHPLWFAMLQCVVLQSSFLTPPFGYALFYFIGVAPQGYTMMHIYRGIVPFVLLQVVGVILLALFPELILWIPRLVFGT